MRLCRTLYLATALICAGSVCLAQGTKLVECPNDRIYRDNRGDAGGGNAGGGQVYCEHVLPGSLVVKDGPFRFWFNRDFEGAAGNYHEGREVGKWKECDRFGRCKETEHPLLYPIEEQRVETRAEVPVSFEKGKYTFDFKSSGALALSAARSRFSWHKHDRWIARTRRPQYAKQTHIVRLIRYRGDEAQISAEFSHRE